MLHALSRIASAALLSVVCVVWADAASYAADPLVDPSASASVTPDPAPSVTPDPAPSVTPDPVPSASVSPGITVVTIDPEQFGPVMWALGALTMVSIAALIHGWSR